MALKLFVGLLAAVVAFQLYRGVVAFRHPEREIPRPGKTHWLVWLLLALVLVIVFLGAVMVGGRIYGP